jgi:hypothetical protein
VDADIEARSITLHRWVLHCHVGPELREDAALDLDEYLKQRLIRELRAKNLIVAEETLKVEWHDGSDWEYEGEIVPRIDLARVSVMAGELGH